MSGQFNRLLVDQGNTSIKYCLADNQGRLSDVQVVTSAQEIPTEGILHVRVASVKSNEDARKLISALSYQVKDCQRLLTSAEAFGVQCAYQNYQSLGVDRWLAVLAAASITGNACAVVDYGTANTVDFLSAQQNTGARQHLGGWIAPGVKTMRSALVNRTANVFDDDKFPLELEIGDSTESCVAHGCLANLYGMLHIAQENLRKITANGKIFLTGGHAKGINLSAFPNIEFREKLVFEGLNRFI
ncbi:MAG: type III pantothenate kinase [Aestuariibacter sp.]